MPDSIGLSHDEYVASRRARDPEFAAAHEETRVAMELALGLADLREHRGLSQRALAEKSGIKQPMINRIERGSQEPRPMTLLKLLAALDGVLTMLPDGTIRVRPAELISAGVGGNNADREPAAAGSSSTRVDGHYS